MTDQSIDEWACEYLSWWDFVVSTLYARLPVSVVLECKPAAPVCPNCHGLGMVDPTGEGALELCECINGD